MRFGILSQTGTTLPNCRVKLFVPSLLCSPPDFPADRFETCPCRNTAVYPFWPLAVCFPINPLLGAFRTDSDGTFTVRFGVAITQGRLQVSHIDPGGQNMTERSTYFAQTLTVLYDRLLVSCQAVFVAILGDGGNGERLDGSDKSDG
jgi:hypothetical protein